MAQTPRGRITRSRSQTPAAVPTVSVGSSTAYGAPGRANLRTQVAAERQTLTAAFDDTARSKTPSRRRRPKGENHTEPTIEEEPADDVTDRSGLAIQNYRYNTARMTGRGTFAGPAGRPTGVAAKPLIIPPHGSPSGVQPTSIESEADYGQIGQKQQIAPQSSNSRLNPERAEYEPSWLETFLLTLQRWTPLVLLQATSRAARATVLFWWAFLTLVAVSTGVGVLGSIAYIGYVAILFFPSINIPWASRPDGIARMTTMWQEFYDHHNTTDPVLNAVMYQGLIFANVADLWENLTEVGEGLVENSKQTVNLAEMVADHAERVFNMDGQLEAFKQQILPSLVVVTKDENGEYELPRHFLQALAAELKSPNSMLYQAFLETNRAQVEALLAGSTDSAVYRKLQEQVQIISREMVIDQLEAGFTQWEAGLTAKMKEIVKQEVELQLEDFRGSTATQREKEAYIKSVSFANQREYFGQRNWFAYNAGAQIVKRLTSPTYALPVPWYAWLSTRKPNPPVTALSKWEEAGDCWCGANSTSGYLQLAIRLRRPVVPQDVFLEHIRHTETDDIAAAPREVEIWGEAAGIQHEGNSCVTSPPTEKHVCLGRGEYDIHGHNWVQKFQLDYVNFGVSGMIIRVLSNWGADHTCIYRVRLHGAPVEASS